MWCHRDRGAAPGAPAGRASTGWTVGVVACLLASCGGDTDVTTTTTEEGLQLEAPGATIVVRGDEGSAVVDFFGEETEGEFRFDDGGVVTEGGDGRFELTAGPPPGWPGFPVPPDATPIRGSVLETGGLRQLSATWSASAGADQVVAFYRGELTDGDIVVEEPDTDGSVLIFSDGDPPATVTITPTPDGTEVSIQVVTAATVAD